MTKVLFQTRLVKTNYTQEINKDYAILNSLPWNSTHYGPVVVEILKDINSYLYNIKVESGSRTVLDVTFNLCKVFKLRRGFFKDITQNFIKLMDEKLLSCPIKKGKYVCIGAREIDFLNTMNVSDTIPRFIPSIGKYVMQIEGRTIVNRKSVSLFNATEWFEFVSE